MKISHVDVARACIRWKHRAKECKECPREPFKGVRRPTHAYHAHGQEKNKNIVVDQEGFRQVKSKKTTRKYIFEDDKWRRDTFLE